METNTSFDHPAGTGARQQTGARGEVLARGLLESLGHTVIEANWRCRFGEIDLITEGPDGVLHIVEVRTRSGSGFGTAAESVTPSKRSRLRRLASYWLADYKPRWARVSFDVVTVEFRGSAVPEIEHLEDVF